MKNTITNKKSLKIQISGSSVIKFHPLSRIREPDNRYYVGHEASNTYLHLDEKYAEMIRLCDGKRNLKKVVNLYSQYHNLPRKKDARKNLLKETIDLMQQLFNYNLIQYINSIELASAKKIRKTKAILKPAFLKYFFSTPAYLLYFFLFTLGFLLTLRYPFLFPRAKDIFWHPQLSYSVITQLIVSIIVISKHEVFHLASAASFGIRGNLSLSKRYFYLVAETKLDNIYKISRDKRIKIYIAGIASDCIVYGLGILILLLSKTNFILSSSLPFGFIKQVVLISWLSIIWQFRIFMKTDIYALIEDYSGYDDLIEFSYVKIKYNLYKFLRYFSKRFSKMYKKYRNLYVYEFYKDIKQISSWYVLFVFFGTILTIIQLFFYEIPITITAVRGAFINIFSGYFSNNLSFFLDGIVVVFIQSLYWGLLLFVTLQDLFSNKQNDIYET